MSRPVVFVDRDGTLIEERGYLSNPDDVRLIEGASTAVRRLSEANFAVVVLTNQSGVARGYFGLGEVEAVHHRLREVLAEEKTTVDGIYFCPHLPSARGSRFGGVCLCRKPYPGLAHEAASVLDLDLTRAFVVGDKLEDLGMANLLRVPGLLVRTGFGRESEFQLGRPGAPKAALVVPHLETAVDWIISRRFPAA